MAEDPFMSVLRALERLAEAVNARMEHARCKRDEPPWYRPDGGPRDWTRPESWARQPKPRRPGGRRRRPRGGEPVPAVPRPKPKPLVDGAEAPIE